MVPPNHPFLIGFSIINHPFWGVSLFLETPVWGNEPIVILRICFFTSCFNRQLLKMENFQVGMLVYGINSQGWGSSSNLHSDVMSAFKEMIVYSLQKDRLCDILMRNMEIIECLLLLGM